jgi:hypothetical protein
MVAEAKPPHAAYLENLVSADTGAAGLRMQLFIEWWMPWVGEREGACLCGNGA